MLVNIANEQVALGHEIGVLVVDAGKTNPDLVKTLDKRILLFCANRKWGAKDIFAIYRLNNLIGRFAPDVIDLHSSSLYKYLYPSFRKSSNVTLHDICNKSNTDHIEYVPRVFSISQSVAKDLMQKKGVASMVNPNGIRPELIQAKCTKTESCLFRIVQVSRLEHLKKGQHILIEAAKSLLDNGITNFHFEIEADLLTDEEIELLNILRPGAVQMEIGVQSTNDATLKEIRRYASVDKIRESVAKLQRGQNIHIHLDLIAGLPYETLDIFKKSFNDVFTMKPEQLQLGFLKVLKGSHMYDMAKEYGLVYKSLPPYEVLYTKWLSYEDVIILKKVEEMVEIYYNSNQYRHVLPVLLSKFPDAFTMFYELAKFYDRKGYCINTPSRSGKYEALLDFADEVCMGEHDIFTELMTFDLYAREKMKSRSGFMNDITKQYKVIRTFFEDEDNIVKYLPDYARYHSKQIMKMTHAEIFHYSVWDEQVREVEPTLVVFDYKIRNPLTGEIKFFLISL